MKGAKPEIREESDPVESGIAPDWLAEAAQAEWNRVVPILIERKILTEADFGNLENYCIAIGRVREFEAKIQNEQDAEMILKLFRAQDKAAGTARQLGAELGLTPVSRSRPVMRPEEGGDREPNPLDV